MEGLPWVLQPLPGERRPQPRVTVMKSRVEKQVQRTTTYLEFMAIRSFRIPVSLAPCWDVSGASGDHLETLSHQLLWEERGCLLLVVGVG